MRDYPNLDNLVQEHLTDLVQRFDEDPFYSRVKYAREALAVLADLRDLGGWIKADLYPEDEARLREAAAEDDAINEEVAAMIVRGCTPELGHLTGRDHRWQECPVYHNEEGE